MKRTWTILLVLLLVGHAANGASPIRLTATNNGAITLLDYTGNGGAVVISNFVTTSARAFDSCSGLTSVTIPNGVTNIGELAFDSAPA